MIVSAKVVSAQTEYENNNCALQTRYVTDVIVSRIAFKGLAKRLQHFNATSCDIVA